MDITERKVRMMKLAEQLGEALYPILYGDDAPTESLTIAEVLYCAQLALYLKMRPQYEHCPRGTCELAEALSKALETVHAAEHVLSCNNSIPNSHNAQYN